MSANVIKSLAPNATSLHRAAWLGKENEVRELLQHGRYHTVNCTDLFKRTPLHYACARGHLGVVKVLVSEFYAKMIIQDVKYGHTPLMLATGSVLDYMVQILSQYKCPNDIRKGDSNTALHYACAVGDTDLVRTLIQHHKVNVYARNENQNTPAHIAALHRQGEVVLTLVVEFSYSIRFRGFKLRNLLHQACAGGDLTLIRTLIHKHQVDIEARDHSGKTPVHVAAQTGQAEVALALIKEFSCDISGTDMNKHSLLYQACLCGCLDLVEFLLDACYSTGISAKSTPAHAAADCGQDEVVLALINRIGFDPNSITNSKGWTLLHSACAGGNVHLVRSLVYKHKTDVNSRDGAGEMPIHTAALHGHAEVVNALVGDFGVDINSRGFKGGSILHRASIHGHSDFIAAFSKSVSPMTVDDDGNTPLHVCSEQGHEECVQALLALNVPLLSRNNSGKTPRDVATYTVKLVLDDYQKENQNKILADYKIMEKHAKKKYSKPQPVTRVFVIGNPGAGKSSLVESLKREGFFNSLQKVSESSVPLHTAGIIPSIHISKHYGRVLFYDFAGDPEYYSSHAAILENLASSESGDNIFVIVVDLREDNATITNTLHFWSSFVGHQKFIKREPYLVAIGSHLDLIKDQKVTKEKSEVFNNFIKANPINQSSYFILNCCKPGSKEIEGVQKHLISLTKNSPLYELSFEASILLGLLEKDFSNVTACPIATITSHIADTKVPLPSDAKLLCLVLEKLHDIGVLLMIGDRTEGDVQVILNTSRLTNEVHKALFSKDENKGNMSTGIIPEALVKNLLPEHVTMECLIKLQYCQRIKLDDIGVFPSIPQSSSADQSILFFPALCSFDKKQVSWVTPPHLSYTIGWFAECSNPCDHFPPRFLHVLLLRLVYRFTLSAPDKPPSQDQPLIAEQDMFEHRCTVWKTGVHWLMEERVECMVELVRDSRGVVVITKSIQDVMENCISVFNRIINCVMEAKAEFCHSIRPRFFLLDSTDGEDYLNDNNMFAMSDVEKALASPEGKKKEAIVSIGGKSFLDCSRLLCMRRLTHWDSLFPIEFAPILYHLRDVVKELFDLGLHLKLPESVLRAGELAHYPRDIDKWRREIVREWMSSSLDPPCWLHLVEALRDINFNELAEEIEEQYGIHIELQKQLLDKAKKSLKPETEFLQLFSGVVGSTWVSLATLLLLASDEIEEVKKGSENNRALCMLKKWVTKEEATYGHLCQKLMTISLFQHH